MADKYTQRVQDELTANAESVERTAKLVREGNAAVVRALCRQVGHDFPEDVYEVGQTTCRVCGTTKRLAADGGLEFTFPAEIIRQRAAELIDQKDGE